MTTKRSPPRRRPHSPRSVFLCCGFFTLLVACAHEALSDSPESPSAAPSFEGSHFDFQNDTLGRAPPGFTLAHTGPGLPGEWVVSTGDARDSRVLAQTSDDGTKARFPVCVLDGLPTRDASLSVRFRAIEGAVDRAAGLVARYRDAQNYYVVRANALEDNVRLYKVVDGQRKQFAGANTEVSAGEWHTLRLDVREGRFAAFFDGAPLFTAEDHTFPDAGRIGLWTKADSVTWFDDLRCESVPSDSPAAR